MIIKSTSEPQFFINTKEHGEIQFGTLSFWREMLIRKLLPEPEKKKEKVVATNIAKGLIYKIGDEVYDKEKIDQVKNKFFSIKLLISNDEIKEFCTKFFENNPDLLGDFRSSLTKVLSSDFYNDIKWEKDPVKKVKQAWILNLKYQNKYKENIVNQLKFSFPIIPVHKIMLQQIEPIHIRINKEFQNSINEIANNMLKKMNNDFQKLSSSIFKSAFQGLDQYKYNSFHWTNYFEKEIQENIKTLEIYVKKLANLGWTIPLWAPINFIYNLANCKSKDINRFFVNEYTRKNNERFRIMFKNYKERVILKEYIIYLYQCRYSYYRKKYLVTVPALFCIIEGLLADIGNTKTKLEKVQNITEFKYKKSKSFSRLIWLSIHEFIRNLFEYHSFSGKKPSNINRHWLFHGRDFRKFSQADCLKLFQTIDVISYMFD